MENNYTADQRFDKIDFTVKPLSKGEYENCTFTACNLSACDLSSNSFIECTFTGCNLSTANIAGVAFRDVHLKDCKMLGLHFETCDHFLFSASFEHCVLNLSSFYKMNLKKQSFKHCSLQEVDFAEADLTAAVFDHCDLLKASFDRTILEKSDFRTATNYSINPNNNKIKKAKFSMPEAAGLLDVFDVVIATIIN